MTRLLLVASTFSILLLTLPADAAPQRDGGKRPPACGAVSFRPVEGRLAEGENRAGHYRSRFGTIDLMAQVQGGQPTDYRVQVNGKPLTPLSGEIPKSAYDCLKSKNIKTPPEPIGGACLGSRFRLAIDNSGKDRLLMLFALQGEEWKLCQAGQG